MTNNECMIPNLAAFHTYAVEWTTTSIKIIYDGRTCLPFSIALTQALGVGTNEFDPGSTPLPATTQLDYVRVWK